MLNYGYNITIVLHSYTFLHTHITCTCMCAVSIIACKQQSALALLTPCYCRHPAIMDNGLPLTETTLKCNEETPYFTDSQYCRTVHIPCGPKLILLLFFLQRTAWMYL